MTYNPASTGVPDPVYAVGHRVMVTCGRPGAWDKPGRVTFVQWDYLRGGKGDWVVGVQFIEGRRSIYFSPHEIAHID